MSQLLDIDLLNNFMAIAQAQSLSRAAQRVGRTQSALSQQLKRLEEVVGQPLFQRTGRGVQLTGQGERLWVHAQRILRLHDEALAELSGKGLSGTLRVGCPDDYAVQFLPYLLRQFASLHPAAQVEVVCAPSPRLREQLQRQALDVALLSAAAGTQGCIREEPLVWVASPGSSAAQYAPLPLALSHPDTLDHLAACQALERAGRAYRVAYASSSLAGLVALVRAGQALAVLTHTAVPADLQVLDGDPALPALPSVGITLGVAQAVRPALVQAFVGLVERVLPGL